MESNWQEKMRDLLPGQVLLIPGPIGCGMALAVIEVGADLRADAVQTAINGILSNLPMGREAGHFYEMWSLLAMWLVPEVVVVHEEHGTKITELCQGKLFIVIGMDDHPGTDLWLRQCPMLEEHRAEMASWQKFFRESTTFPGILRCDGEEEPADVPPGAVDFFHWWRRLFQIDKEADDEPQESEE